MDAFQRSVGTQPAPAVAGDFSDSNPRVSYNAGPGALIADPTDGVTVGLFAWVTFDSNGQALSIANSGSGAPQGFVHREQQGIITEFLAGAGMHIPGGMNVTLHSEGGFWAKNETGGAVAVGDEVFVDDTNGTIVAGPASGDVVNSGWTFASAAEDDELVKITTHRNV